MQASDEGNGLGLQSWTASEAMAKASVHRCKRDMAWSEDAGREVTGMPHCHAGGDGMAPSVEVVTPPQEFFWDRAKLYPKQEAAIFERKRISVIEASTKSGKTDPACSMVGGVTSARSA